MCSKFDKLFANRGTFLNNLVNLWQILQALSFVANWSSVFYVRRLTLHRNSVTRCQVVIRVFQITLNKSSYICFYDKYSSNSIFGIHFFYKSDHLLGIPKHVTF